MNREEWRYARDVVAECADRLGFAKRFGFDEMPSEAENTVRFFVERENLHVQGEIIVSEITLPKHLVPNRPFLRMAVSHRLGAAAAYFIRKDVFHNISP